MVFTHKFIAKFILNVYRGEVYVAVLSKTKHRSTKACNLFYSVLF